MRSVAATLRARESGGEAERTAREAEGALTMAAEQVFVPPQPERINELEVKACEDGKDDDQEPHPQTTEGGLNPAGGRRRQKPG